MNQSKKRPINAVGVLFYSTSTNRVLYLLRNDREQCWGIPGGKIERGEVLREALKRECSEEISTWQDDFKLYPLECYTNGTFKYHTFFVAVDDEFVPRLNDEHCAYCWCEWGAFPRPLHSGLFSTVQYPIIQQKISLILEALKQKGP